MDGKWGRGHERLLAQADCDIWLLTEVADRLVLPGYVAVRTATPMGSRKTWAAVLARDALGPLPEPHPATASGQLGGIVIWSSILPWRSSGGEPPWVGSGHGARTAAAVDTLVTEVPDGPSVWGGDFNHSLVGPELAGSLEGRRVVTDALDVFGLQVPTAELEHQKEGGLYSIDHIAVPRCWTVVGTTRIHADGRSDHDAYTVDTTPPEPG